MKLPCLFCLVPFVVYFVFHCMAMCGLLIAFQQYPVNTIIISVVLPLGADVIVTRSANGEFGNGEYEVC